MENTSRAGRSTKPTVDFIARNKAKIKEIARTRSQSKGLEDQENSHQPTKPHFKSKKLHPAKQLAEASTNTTDPQPSEAPPQPETPPVEEVHSTSEVQEVKTEVAPATTVAPSEPEDIPTEEPAQEAASTPVPVSSPDVDAAPSHSAEAVPMTLSDPQPACHPSEVVIVDPCPKRSHDSAPEAVQPSPKRFKRLSQGTPSPF